jgi:hypothetical protein
VPAIFLLVFIGSGAYSQEYEPFLNSSDQCNARHVFTWISKVTPELAKWANNMSFTDAVTSENKWIDCHNLMIENITYWYCVNSYVFSLTDFADIESMKQELTSFAAQSPNRHVYLDDTHIVLDNYGTESFSILLDAIREVQSDNITKFILNAFINTSLYLQINMTDIDFDAYQPPTFPYDYTIELLKSANPETVGIYVWAYGCTTGGISWDTMTEPYLNSIYERAKNYSLTRITIWDGLDSSNACLSAASLYLYPEWWDRVRTENMRFIEGTG